MCAIGSGATGAGTFTATVSVSGWCHIGALVCFGTLTRGKAGRAGRSGVGSFGRTTAVRAELTVARTPSRTASDTGRSTFDVRTCTRRTVSPPRMRGAFGAADLGMTD